jgi:hypothetical protein
VLQGFLGVTLTRCVCVFAVGKKNGILQTGGRVPVLFLVRGSIQHVMYGTAWGLEGDQVVRASQSIVTDQALIGLSESYDLTCICTAHCIRALAAGDRQPWSIRFRSSDGESQICNAYRK